MHLYTEQVFEIPFLNNISDSLSTANAELELYLDVLHDDNTCDPYTIKHLIINLSACIELLVKFRLLEEHWAFIFDDINKANEENIYSGDFLSVSFSKGIERLLKLCGINKQKYFSASQKLYKYRNRAVHITLNDDFKSIVTTILGSISEVVNFSRDEIIPHIQNDDAVTDINHELDNLLSLQTDLRATFTQLSPTASLDLV